MTNIQRTPETTPIARSLQESIPGGVAFDEAHGDEITAHVGPQHFDSPYRDFAIAVLRYRQRFGRPPGINHIHDLAAQSAMGKDNTLITKR